MYQKSISRKCIKRKRSKSTKRTSSHKKKKIFLRKGLTKDRNLLNPNRNLLEDLLFVRVENLNL